MKTINKKGSIHLSAPVVINHCSYLPTTIFSMVGTLCLEDKEILACLIKDLTPTNSNSNKAKKTCPRKKKTIPIVTTSTCMLHRSAANVYHATWITGKKKAMAKKEKRRIKYSTTKIVSELGSGKLASAVDSNTSDCTGEEKGSVRMFLNFIGERVMGGVLEVVN
ncbi:hypothetical protein ACFE04_021102 [Oxalis oulophora]